MLADCRSRRCAEDEPMLPPHFTEQESEKRLRQACAELVQGLRAGRPCRAEEWFATFPDLAERLDPFLELVYTEFVTREELFQQPDPAEYCRRFPDRREALEKQFAVHSLLGNASPGASGPKPSALADMPRRVGAYELMGKIAHGGTGVVYRARHRELTRAVALKMIAAAPGDARRVVTEAEAIARLRHPSIVQIYEIGRHDGWFFLALEFVPGGSLANHLAGAPQAPDYAAGLVETLAQTMHYAHTQGVVHRDLKPANVLLAADGTPRITDFGLAKLLDGQANQTRTGSVFGTPSYMAPEQAAGQSDVGAAADVYALGAILYEALTGRPPFRADTPLNTLHQVMADDPVPPDRLQPGVPPDLATICLQCLHKEPHRRYHSAQALAADLRRFLNREPIQARPASLAGRAWKWARRRPVIAVLTCLLGTSLAALLLGNFWYTGQLADLTAEARRQQADAESAVADVNRQRGEIQRQAAILQQQQQAMRESLYTIQLRRVDEVWRTNPVRALSFLEDRAHCPPELRDFPWRLYRHLCNEDRFFNGYFRGVTLLAVSPDGMLLAALNHQSRTLRVWHLGTGEERRSARLFDRPPACMAFSPDGQTLAVGSADLGVVLWGLTTYQARPLAVAGGARALAFSPDGRLLVIGNPSGAVTLWDLRANARQATYQAHPGGIASLAFSPDGKALATASDDPTVRLWGVADQQQRASFRRATPESAAVLCFSPDGKRLTAVGTQQAAVDVWDVEAGRTLGSFTAFRDGLSAVTLAPDARTLAAGGADGTVAVWDVGTGRELYTTAVRDGEVRALTFTPDGQSLVSGGLDARISIQPVRQPDGDPTRDFGSHIAAVTFAGGKCLAVGTDDGRLQLLHPAALEEQSAVQRNAGKVVALAAAADGRTLATAHGNNIKLWQAPALQELASLPGHRRAVTGLAFSPDGRTLASASDDGTVRLWDIASRKERAVLESDGLPVRCLAYAPQSHLLATGNFDGTVRLWDARWGKEEARLERHHDRVLAVVFSPDGQTLASGSADDTVCLWHVPRRTVTATLVGHLGTVTGLAVTPDSRTLAVSSRLRRPGDAHLIEVKLWDVATGDCRARLPGEGGPVAFSPDGRTLATVEKRTQLRLRHTTADR